MGSKLAGRSECNSSAGGEKKDKVLTVVLTIILIFMSSLIIINPSSVAPRPRGSQPQIEYLAITTIIDNNYAVTNIKEKFINPYSYPIDETFQFQIPAKAFISNFSLTVDNEIHYSQIVPSSVGKEKYNNAVITGSDAGLVEEKDKNIFSYSVSLSPISETIVGLRYEQFLEKSLGGYEYKIPLKDSDVGGNIKKFSIEITVRSKLYLTDLDIDGYSDKANVTYVSSDECKVTYLTSSSTPTQDFIINYKLAAPPVNGTMLNYNDGAEEYFFHIFSPQRSDLGGKTMPKEIIFVLDKSGSMSGTKISQLKSAFEKIINQLQPYDTFNLIMFDNTIEKYKTKLIDASEENKAEAVEYINDVYASGSTNINGALITALDMFSISETKMPIIVMLTDGLPTAGETDTKSIRENIKIKNVASVSLFCLGFGFDVDFDFLKAMSLENFGIAIRIYENEAASVQITDFYDTISTPLLRGLTFSYSSGAYEVYPTYVEQLFEGAEIVIVGKYNGTSRKITATVNATSWEGKKTFSETFILDDFSDFSFISRLSSYDKVDDISKNITGTSKSMSWKATKKVNESYKLKDSISNSFIPRFWAYAKIRYLLDEIAITEHNNGLVELVTDLALTYGFVTPYTSLLVEIVEPESDGDHDMPNDGIGAEGESESEAESESESESEVEAQGELVIDGELVESIEITSNKTILIESLINESKDDDEAESESEVEIKQGEYSSITISITNNNNDQCRVYWLGIHLDWQPKYLYQICTNISSEDPKYIAPGQIEYFYIYIENPNNDQIDNQSYDMVFQYELQDGWFDGWSDYSWQSRGDSDFEINETAPDALVVVPLVPNCEEDNEGEFDSSEQLLSTDLIHELIPTQENGFETLPPIDTGGADLGGAKKISKPNEASEGSGGNAQDSGICTNWVFVLSSGLVIIIIIPIVLILRKRKGK